MDDEVELAPSVFQLAEAGIKAFLVGHVDVDQKVRAQRGGQRLDAFAESLAVIEKFTVTIA